MTASSNSITVSSLLGDLTQYVTNPSLMQKRAMQALTQLSDGTIEIVDATNPFALCLELSACNTAAFMQEAAALTRRLYPAASTTFDDLFVNMSDTDYINMFALPGNANFMVMLQYDQLLNALVTDSTTGISQITVPRNTMFKVADTTFSLQYPINIRQLQHGGLQVVYDASQVSPLLTLDTNVLPMDTVTMGDGLKYLRFWVNAQQFFITTTTVTVSPTSSKAATIALTDEFYYCRAYLQNNDHTWSEIATTFTQQVYDPNTPTIALKLVGDVLEAVVPPVYLFNNTIRGPLRLDVYQTKGPISLSLASYNPKTDFVAKWYFIDQNDASAQTTAINKITDIIISSTDLAQGGRAALTFDQMRARVIANSIGPRQVPITPAQIQALLTDDGYTVVKDVDVVTGRSFWVTKSLPSPTDLTTTTNNVFTPANASMLTVTLNLAQGANSYGCTVHATGITVTSAALFNTNGVSSLVTTAAYNQITGYPLLQQADLFNQGNYFFTPFYYVLDDSTDVFDVRPYFLDQPTITARTFVRENATTGLQVSIANSSFGVTKTALGYRLTLSTTSNATWQNLPDNQVGCQLAFLTTNGTTVAYMLGTQQARQGNAGERTYTFDITTSYDIDADHGMDLSSFATATPVAIVRSLLEQSFQVLFYTTSTMPSTYTTSTIDSLLGNFQIGQSAVGITYEELKIKFGNYLPTLWNNYRSFASQIPYQTYGADVPAVRTAPLYQLDPVTGAPFTVVTPTPTLTLGSTGSGGLTGVSLALNYNALTGTSADVGKVFKFDNGKTATVTTMGTNHSATVTLSAVASGTSFTTWSFNQDLLDVNNGLVWTVLATAGSPILDSSGNPTYLHRAGDPIMSQETGLPVAAINYTTQLTRLVDFFAISAVYRFANDPITTTYMDYVKTSLLNWLTEDLVTLNEQVLEKTNIFFFPAVTQGTVGVFIENNVLVSIDAAQSLEATLYVPTETANNSALLASLTAATIQTIGKYLATNTTVARSKVEAACMAVYGSDVAEMELKGFGGMDNNYSIMTLESSSTLLSIGKILAVQTNNQMTVQEAIKVTFITHDVN